MRSDPARAMRRSAAALAAALAPCAACATAPPEAPVPLLEVTGEHYTGTVLSGPLDAQVPEQALSDPWFVELRLAYVEEPPPGAAAPLSAAAREVVVDGAPALLATRGELALDVVRTAARAPHARWELFTLDALWPGTTLVRRARANSAVEAEDRPAAPWRGFEVELARRADAPAGAEMALAFEGLVAPRPADEEGALAAAEAAAAALEEAQGGAEPEPKPQAPVLVREHVVLDEAPGPGQSLSFFLPAPTPRLPRGGYALEVALRADFAGAAGEAERTAALARGQAGLERSRKTARDRSSVFSASEGFQFESAGALAALAERSHQRTALAFLAHATGAELSGELALLAEPETLAGCLGALRARIEAEGAPTGEPAALGWFLERATYGWLAARASDESQPLQPELEALLLRHTGQLGRYPDLVMESVGASTGLADHRRRVQAENAIFLEDADPAARVRAFDWLKAQGLAPEGYDPLAAPAERRAALARAAEAAGAGAEAPGGAQR